MATRARKTTAAKTKPASAAAHDAPRRRGHMLWKGAIAFGLVHVPVELYTAASRTGLELDMLDKRSMQPIGYKKINKISGKEVANEDIVKGYEYEKGQYVVLGAEDFKRANPKATQTVEILAFVDRDEIPSIYYEAPYYLVPTRQGAKVYALLRETMLRADCVAIATVVIQTKQHLAAVIADGEKLVLNTLRYADEIRDTSGFAFPGNDIKVKPEELKMAQQLIDSMRGEWEPEAWHDTYREDVMARIHAKVEAGELQSVPSAESGEGDAPRSAEVIDLMSLLKKSIPTRGKAAPADEDAEAAPAPRKRAAASKPAAKKSAPRKTAPAPARSTPARKRA